MIGPNSSGRLLAKLVSSVPATVEPSTVRERVGAYYDSYRTGDLAGREALFADDCHLEDPAGRVVATGRRTLHEFFARSIPADWSIMFRLDRVAVVGNEALATTTLTLHAAGDPARTPVDVIVNTHFVFTDAGTIGSLRTFFDEESMRDSDVEQPAN